MPVATHTHKFSLSLGCGLFPTRAHLDVLTVVSRSRARPVIQSFRVMVGGSPRNLTVLPSVLCNTHGP